ncbi:uncharacterized protein JN550_011548 [Neoarthrinium moseri]|uniref:uncharacterized protein n=1 Tax=Neoarthrinium moseri TaxID=1658444 RepID=UPI001FDB96F1|nr:uncharacterized protein JN550_011548 [Neoarthrinium moseri]KAI1860396.1 hypothetical protein JN550_011548 [Neoarthrinium moseri]
MARYGTGAERSVLLFGGLSLNLDASALELVRKALIEHEENKWGLDVIRELPSVCETALRSLPVLHQATGKLMLRQLADLEDAFTTGRPLDKTSYPLPNSLLIPITVIRQLAQYGELLQENKIEGILHGRHENLGLCTGLLSAFVASSARNIEEFQQLAAVAVRLGLLIGLVVDGQDASLGMGRSKSLTAAWSSDKAPEILESILEEFRDAYVSVYYDKNCVTITVSPDRIPELSSRLRAAGISASEINLYGRFHSSNNSPLVDELVAFCDSHAMFQLPNVAALAMPTRANDIGGSLMRKGSLHGHALRAILVEPAQWFDSFSESTAPLSDTQVTVFELGTERSVPTSLALKPPRTMKIVHLADTKGKADRQSGRISMENDIAVVGMSCKVPGANDLEEFWDLIAAARSQHQEIGPGSRSIDRFSFNDGPFRTIDDPNMNRKWFANLIDGYDQFDHRFFKKSARESASMDPQQRHILQVAYQALEQSGYFHNQATIEHTNRSIGCFVGVCLSDYDNNVASHPANALTATGNLQGFIAGKVSHFFGWTGPSITLNTACSSSLVAVHQACQSILTGECEAALAGGTHILTSAEWFQNLAAGSFLSPTGQCKPFDEKADGYCRGEGAGVVFLKKLSKAAADGDPILGVIAATSVQQNQNCTPIFVPNVPSLGNLFTKVMDKARVKPSQVTVVEGHGTGTPVGDPAEYDSIRRALGGPTRGPGNQLAVGSVKGLVGHMECTSGVISLIKVLLMIQKGTIQPQASFNQANPSLKISPSDQMFIPTRALAWDSDFRVALINNYGASGSNASVVVIQPPSRSASKRQEFTVREPSGLKYPFWFTGFDKNSIRRYFMVFRKYLQRPAAAISLAGLSFNLATQSNRNLAASLMLTASSVNELDQKLATFIGSDGTDGPSVEIASHMTVPNVILCFGGQSSPFVGLDRYLYENIAILRKHLDQVDAVVQSLSKGTCIFPGIFQRTPVDDVVELQAMIFAMQYACAQSWIDVGVRPSALVGHSFGELTALCVAQVLSLEDTVKMILRRATVIKEHWGPERGAMLAVQATLADVTKLLAEANADHSGEPASIACYNGPSSFTIAGPTRAIDAVVALFKKKQPDGEKKGNQIKRLAVTHAFHSVLADPLLGKLVEAFQGLTFREAKFHVERAVPDEAVGVEHNNIQFIAKHIRSPVYFHHAIERLVRRRHTSSPCVFLEAGTNTSITSIAAHALGNVKGNFSFHGLKIASGDDGWNKLTETTMSLWKTARLAIHHWAHHPMQRHHVSLTLQPLFLPPYQFDPDSRHWLALKTLPKAMLAADAGRKAVAEAEKKPQGLLTFIGHLNTEAEDERALFRVETAAEKYKNLLSGHVTLQTAPILSATLQISFVIDAIDSAHPEYKSEGYQPQIQEVEYHSPVCFNSARTLWVEVSYDTSKRARVQQGWTFEVFSCFGKESNERTVHTTGKVVLSSSGDSSLKRELAHFERLLRHHRASSLLQSSDAEEILGKRSIYRLFSDIVDYGEEFRGMVKMAKRGNDNAGHIVRLNTSPEREWFDPHLADTFCQLGGIWINYMAEEHGQNHVFLANGIDRWIRSYHSGKRPSDFHALAVHDRPSAQLCLTDVFIFDAADGALVEVILGICYVKIPRLSMEKMLSRLSCNVSESTATATVIPTTTVSALKNLSTAIADEVPLVAGSASQQGIATGEPAPSATEGNAFLVMAQKIKDVISDLSGIDVSEIKDDSELADLGIDSLTGMEMMHQIESNLKVKLPEAEMMLVVSITELVKCVAGAMCITDSGLQLIKDSDSDDYPSVMEASDSSVGQTNTDISTPFPELDVEQFEEQEEHNASAQNPTLSLGAALQAFHETKKLTDMCVVSLGQERYATMTLPIQNNLTVALTLEVLQSLGAGFEHARPGQKLSRIPHCPEHHRFVSHLYDMLEAETQIIKIDGSVITRTAVPLPDINSKDLFQVLQQRGEDQHSANKLIYYAGKSLRRVLSGETSGVKVIFGDEEGRELVSKWYADWPLNKCLIGQIADFVRRLLSKLQTARISGTDRNSPLRILEMGGGTGGTTRQLVPLLAQAQIPIEYTFTDLAPSFVSAARKKWAKEYSWMKFRVHDIESEPAQDLQGMQDLVIASNAIHATKSLSKSLRNVRKALRPDGILVMLEMTRTPYWVDLIFGLFEGWWLFADERNHALTNELIWQRELHAAGYGEVDWTDGEMPETALQRVIMAAASSTSRSERTPVSLTKKKMTSVACMAREQTVAGYVQEFTRDFDAPLRINNASFHEDDACISCESQSNCVLITGGTGGLGAHLVASAALRTDVSRVICLNRPRQAQEPKARQLEALRKKCIELPPDAKAKIEVWETDLSQPVELGLSHEQYLSLIDRVTRIVHNAWLMHSKWPVKRFEPQLRIMANMLNLARDISARHPRLVWFEFVSSIATIGHHSFWTGSPMVPEERVPIESVLPTGYGEAKYICERMLDATLHRFPERFQATVVRLGQIAGSKTNGHWNPMEHVPFMIKSSQCLGAVPELPGTLGWTPSDDIASALIEILMQPSSVQLYPVYHIENPIRQAWSDTLATLIDALRISGAEDNCELSKIPFQEWLERVRSWPRSEDNGPQGANPGFMLVDFLKDNFVRISCGGLLMATAKAREHSPTMARLGPVSDELIRSYVQSWKESGFLN